MSSRILTVNLDTKYYQSSIPVRRITYMQSAVDLTEDEYNDIVSKIPSFWNSENDKLIRFVYFDDDTYFCERVKNIFNYSTRETESKVYKFDYGTVEEGKALYAYFIEKYAKIKIARTENLYDTVIEQIGDLSFIKLSLLDARDKLLKESDFFMLPDYPISDEEKQKWVSYRQQLRDLTIQEAWISNDLMNIKFPVSPDPSEQLNYLRGSIRDLSSIPENLTQELIDSIVDQPLENIVENIAQTSIKFDLLKSISNLRIPILNIDYDDIVKIEHDYDAFVQEVGDEALAQSILPKSWWETATTNLEDKINKINEVLSHYNVNFTINDILNSIIESNKLTDEEIEVNTIIDEL